MVQLGSLGNGGSSRSDNCYFWRIQVGHGQPQRGHPLHGAPEATNGNQFRARKEACRDLAEGRDSAQEQGHHGFAFAQRHNQAHGCRSKRNPPRCSSCAIAERHQCTQQHVRRLHRAQRGRQHDFVHCQREPGARQQQLGGNERAVPETDVATGDTPADDREFARQWKHARRVQRER